MKERSLLLTKNNRQKMRDGVKTMTRRIVNIPEGYTWGCEDCYDDGNVEKILCSKGVGCGIIEIKPKYQVGDHIWMLEPYQILGVHAINSVLCGIFLDDNILFEISMTADEMDKLGKRKKPYMKTSSRYMYKSLARTWAKCTEVIAERLQEITQCDMLREGISVDENNSRRYPQKLKADFITLWDSINKDRGYGWDKNPWVFGYRWELM